MDAATGTVAAGTVAPAASPETSPVPSPRGRGSSGNTVGFGGGGGGGSGESSGFTNISDRTAAVVSNMMEMTGKTREQVQRALRRCGNDEDQVGAVRMNACACK